MKVFAAHKNLPLKLVYHPPNKLSSSCFPSLPSLQTSSSSTSLSGAHNLSIVKKLVCKLCNNSIADNPKSVGIHVKNHLNYKPFRCPFCKYVLIASSTIDGPIVHVFCFSGICLVSSRKLEDTLNTFIVCLAILS